MDSASAYTVRFTGPGDFEAVLGLARAFAVSFAVEEERFRAVFGELIADRSACVRVAALDGAVVGYVLGFEHLSFFANGRVAWVEELMVADAHRRKGVGEALMTAVEDWAVQRGCRMIALATRRAADFYAAIGYEASATYFRKIIGANGES